jgi:hypothetical protein
LDLGEFGGETEASGRLLTFTANVEFFDGLNVFIERFGSAALLVYFVALSHAE